jgi:hypothetical protein
MHIAHRLTADRRDMSEGLTKCELGRPIRGPDSAGDSSESGMWGRVRTNIGAMPPRLPPRAPGLQHVGQDIMGHEKGRNP